MNLLITGLLAKIFDWVILNKYTNNFSSSYLQYGCKPNSSMHICFNGDNQ